MMLTILSGKKAREALLPDLMHKIRKLSVTPTLVIIQVGNRPDSTTYIHAKKSFAQKIGVNTKHIHLGETVTQEELVQTIHEHNQDASVHGIIVQLPLPAHIDRTVVIEAIQPAKDVDGLTSVNYGKLITHDSTGIIPATARGVMKLLHYYDIDISGKKVAVVGRSHLVGTPIAILCKNKGADVIICHSQTPDLAHETRQADILIVAVGKAHLIGLEHVKQGQIVIDIGMSKVSDGSIQGDVDFEAVKNTISALSPVPGGVGPMTVLGLFENVVDAVLQLNKN